MTATPTPAQAAAMRKPIYGTDLTKPRSALMAEWRSQIVTIRGQMNDLGFAFSGWREEMAMLEGGLTCMLIAMHHTLEEMRKGEALAADEAAAALAESRKNPQTADAAFGKYLQALDNPHSD